MDDNKTKQVIDYIYKDVFARENIFSLSEFQKKFAIDIPSLRKVKCQLSNEDTWIYLSSEEKVASQKTIADQFKKDAWIKPKEELKSISDILKAWDRVNYQTAEKYINSTNVSKSDGIYNSNNIYNSLSIFDSKNIVFSYKLFDCNYMAASRDNSSCTVGIRVRESIYCSSSFEVSWSSKVSKSMFIHDSYDIYECLFCSHIRSKKYCIANMQFNEDEYFRLKEKVINWILGFD